MGSWLDFAVDSQLKTAVKVWLQVVKTTPRFVRWYSEGQIQSQWAAGDRATLDTPYHLESVRYQYALKNPSAWGQYFELREELVAYGVIDNPERLKLYKKVVKRLNKEVSEKHAQVIFCTITGSHSPNLTKDDKKKGKLQYFQATTIIADEAGTIYRPQMMMLIMAFRDAKRAVFAGDIQQLPGFQANKLTKKYLPVSFMEDVMTRGFPVGKLNDQYRMHDELYAHTAAVIYKQPIGSQKKTSEPSILRQELLASPIQVKTPAQAYELRSFLHLVDVPHGIQEYDENSSSFNVPEAEAIETMILALVATGKAQSRICVITGYQAQRKLLAKKARRNGWGDVRCLTIDASQGEQWEIVFLSLVTIKGLGELDYLIIVLQSLLTNLVGFMGKKQRANVATSRQQEALYLVGKADFWLSQPPKKSSKKWMHAIIKFMQDDAVAHNRPAFVVGVAPGQVAEASSAIQATPATLPVAPLEALEIVDEPAASTPTTSAPPMTEMSVEELKALEADELGGLSDQNKADLDRMDEYILQLETAANRGTDVTTELATARHDRKAKEADGKEALDKLKRDFQARMEALEVATVADEDVEPETEAEEGEEDGGDA
ncbi:MAG: hypothetical protein Q9198_003794 [Flavoplaca austrocitrina]